MILHKSVHLNHRRRNKKITCSDLAAYVAGRQGSEGGALCNDRATQLLVIIHAMLFIYFDSLTFFFCYVVVTMTLL
jgi:hypothetical protein